MWWSWTFPGTASEALLGILLADDVNVMNEKGTFTCSLISIGILVGRVDILFDYKKTEED